MGSFMFAGAVETFVTRCLQMRNSPPWESVNIYWIHSTYAMSVLKLI